MGAELAETDACGHRLERRVPGLGRDDDLSTMAGEADPGRGVDGQADVPRLGERRTAALDTGADTALEIVRPPEPTVIVEPSA